MPTDQIQKLEITTESKEKTASAVTSDMNLSSCSSRCLLKPGTYQKWFLLCFFFFYLLAPLPHTNSDGVIGIKRRICLAERLHLSDEVKQSESPVLTGVTPPSLGWQETAFISLFSLFFCFFQMSWGLWGKHKQDWKHIQISMKTISMCRLK